MTVLIPLSRGHFAIADEADAPCLLAMRWHARPIKRVSGGFYAAGRIPGVKTQYMHRFLLGAECGQEVDHISGDELDNRRCNLRLASRSQNSANRDVKPSESGFRGVAITRYGRFRAQVGRQPYMFTGPNRLTAEEAARDYDNEAFRRFGVFARTNFSAAGAA